MTTAAHEMTVTEHEAHESDQAYWDQYYSNLTAVTRPLPSPFGVFVAGELQSPHRVVDFGCGDGRDSLLFSSHGHRVIGVDASHQACRSSSSARPTRAPGRLWPPRCGAQST